MSVFNLKRGERAKITYVGVDGAVGERLKSLGVVKGAIVTAAGFSLFSGGILILCGYNRIALRRSIAEKIEAERC